MEDPINILIVDDEPKNLTVLEAVLDRPGYRLVRAASADEALLALVAEEFALLILDIRMPGMTGLELAHMIKDRKKTSRVPIIFLTAYYNQDQHLLEGYGTGAVDYLLKPVNPAILRSKVAVFAELHRKTRESELANVALLAEVTERRRIQEQLRERTARLQALALELTQAENRERRRVAQVLHDHLQQWLVAAKMRLESLQAEVVSDEGRQHFEAIQQVLTDSIEASRSLAIELSPPVLFSAGFTAALHWLARWMNEKQRLNVRIEADPAINLGNADMNAFLFQATRELLFNVVKHADATQALVRLKRNDDGFVELIVEDQGKGFDAQSIADSPDRPTGQVTTCFGLLSIRERLELLGGCMTIKSTRGQGTRISISLPLPQPRATVHPIPFGPAVATVRSSPARAGKLRILVADDHKLVREAFMTILNSQPDIEVVGEAPDGLVALELVSQLRPDLVLMDVNMPNMDGIEATCRITAQFPAVRVIGLSMHTGPEVAAKMRLAGAVDYLSKDGSEAALIAAIHRCCRTAAVAG